SHPNQQKIIKCKAILEGRRKIKNLNITDYIIIFADYLNLAPVKVVIRRNYGQIKPFKEFVNSNLDDKIPTWWKAYNKLKHDFYSNVNQGTLENALASLSALFALNCKLPQNREYLISNRVITSPNFIHTGHLLVYIDKDPKLEKYSLLAETDLFEYWLSYHEETFGVIVAEELAVEDSLKIPTERSPGL
ncbi:unnamed protein product, partial [marine sediment metagenome]